MSDPHIDIDEPENFASGDTTQARSDNGFNQRAKIKLEEGLDDEADWGQADEPMVGGYNFGEVFSSMSQQFRRWQNAAGANNFGRLPDDTLRHFRASQREFLLGWRSLLDYSLEQIDQRESRDRLRTEANITDDGFPTKADKIVVEEIED